MQRITSRHAKVDRFACPWLIRHVVDQDAEFLDVPLANADLPGAYTAIARHVEALMATLGRPLEARHD